MSYIFVLELYGVVCLKISAKLSYIDHIMRNCSIYNMLRVIIQNKIIARHGLGRKHRYVLTQRFMTMVWKVHYFKVIVAIMRQSNTVRQEEQSAWTAAYPESGPVCDICINKLNGHTTVIKSLRYRCARNTVPEQVITSARYATSRIINFA